MSGMHFSDVLIAPVVSEKTNDMMIEENKYVFIVSPRATKIDIRRAVSQRYNVVVDRVNLINLPRKPKRAMGRGYQTGKRRKAIVTLIEGQGIPELSQAV
jgi:large subunit ribosomal protein L23